MQQVDLQKYDKELYDMPPPFYPAARKLYLLVKWYVCLYVCDYLNQKLEFTTDFDLPAGDVTFDFTSGDDA